MSFNEFHIHVHGPFSATDASADAKQPALIPSSFDDCLRRLQAAIPSALIEGDGSIAWASPNHQVAGIVYDAGEQVHYIELRGHCSGKQLRHLVDSMIESKKTGDFAVMVLPDRQWKNLQEFASGLG